MSASLPRVHVVLATYEPRADHLAALVASVLAQEDVELTMTVVDDGSSAEGLARVRSAVARRRGVTLVPLEHAGVVRTVERGLALVPDGIDAVLLADQDDVWAPDKAARLVARLREGHLLVHGDATVVDDAGRELAPSLFALEERDVNGIDAADLVVRNVVTGCTVALAPRLVRAALPFPLAADDRSFLHDLWLALVAASLGTVGVEHRPLVAYRQHAGNVIGAAAGYGAWPGWAKAGGAWRLRRTIAEALVAAARDGRLPRPGWGVRAWTGPLAELTCMVRLAAVAVDLPGSRRLARTLAAGALVSLGRRMATVPALIAGHLGSKGRKVVGILAHVVREPRRAANALARSAGITGDGPVAVIAAEPWPPQQRAIRSLFVDRPGRVVNVLIPGVSPSGVFGGVATAVTLAVRLAQVGERVRLVLCDYGQSLGEERVRALILRHVAATPDALARIAVTDAIRDDRTLDLGPGDVFLATAWWTAFRAAATIAAEPRLAERRVHYLVQDHEPLFYPASDRQLWARRSYELDALLLVNSTPLAEHLEAELGVRVDPELVLAPVIEIARAPLRAMPAAGEPLRVAVYARPSVGRNLFDTALRGVALWVDARRRSDPSAGPVEVVTLGERLDRPHEVAGLRVRDLGTRSWDEYLAWLGRSHLGVSLMTSPHPSYPPLEMAASGMVVVTNRWGPKDLGRLTRRIVSCDPEPTSVAGALARAEQRLTVGGDPPLGFERLGVGLDAFVAAYRERLDRPARTRRRR